VYRKYLIVVLLTLLGGLFFSCSHGPRVSCSDGPSEDIIKSTITREYERVNIRSRVEEIHIKEIGKFDEQRNYWPVRATVVCKLRDACIHKYDVEYGFYKDEHGSWQGRALKAVRK
jgi:hypothetical protein